MGNFDNNGNCDGYWESYHSNGNLLGRGNYKYGLQIGYWIYYDFLTKQTSHIIYYL